MTQNRIHKIKTSLSTLAPTYVDVIDNSHLHIGHEGAKTGKGHFAVTIVASCFEGQSLIQRHRLVYSALLELIETDIHAVEIKAFTPEEFERIS